MLSLKNANIIHYLILLFKQHTKTGHAPAVVAANASAIVAASRSFVVVFISLLLFGCLLEMFAMPYT